MATTGVYGTTRPAILNPDNDIEMFYHYRPTRSSDSVDFSEWKCLDSSYIVEQTFNGETINGLFNLRLPLDVFNMKGFYSIYIRPKEYSITLTDVSVLAAYPDIKGVIINSNYVSGQTNLDGYLIQYKDTDGNKTETVRLITSTNRCEPVLVNVSDTYPKATRYRLVDSTTNNLLFCTVTPSSANSFRPNVTPYIGSAGDSVILSNTKFNPILLEVEMTDTDIESLAESLTGDQTRNRDAGIITTYTKDHLIKEQYDVYTVKNELGEPKFDAKIKRTSIDNTQSYDNLIGE